MGAVRLPPLGPVCSKVHTGSPIGLLQQGPGSGQPFTEFVCPEASAGGSLEILASTLDLWSFLELSFFPYPS